MVTFARVNEKNERMLHCYKNYVADYLFVWLLLIVDSMLIKVEYHVLKNQRSHSIATNFMGNYNGEFVAGVPSQ